MRLKHFRKMVYDTHLSIRDLRDRELEYLSEFTTMKSDYEDFQISHIFAEDYRLIKVYVFREMTPIKIERKGKRIYENKNYWNRTR